MEVLNDLRPGDRGIVIRIRTTGILKRRLCDMGITPGVRIWMKRIAPFGDPLSIFLRGYELSIRRSEAKKIEIRREGDGRNR